MKKNKTSPDVLEQKLILDPVLFLGKHGITYIDFLQSSGVSPVLQEISKLVARSSVVSCASSFRGLVGSVIWSCRFRNTSFYYVFLEPLPTYQFTWYLVVIPLCSHRKMYENLWAWRKEMNKTPLGPFWNSDCGSDLIKFSLLFHNYKMARRHYYCAFFLLPLLHP